MSLMSYLCSIPQFFNVLSGKILKPSNKMGEWTYCIHRRFFELLPRKGSHVSRRSRFGLQFSRVGGNKGGVYSCLIAVTDTTPNVNQENIGHPFALSGYHPSWFKFGRLAGESITAPQLRHSCYMVETQGIEPWSEQLALQADLCCITFYGHQQIKEHNDDKYTHNKHKSNSG